MPADKEMGFGIFDFRYADWAANKSRVSKTVVAREWWRRSMSASMAATGMVRSGSSWRRRW